MNLDHLITQLSNHAESIRSLTAGVSAEQARWKPDPDARSILEVINHLYDEEREDFHRHLDDLLHHPDQPWHSIDPEAWVTQRAYNERDLDQSVANFLQERQESLAWLRGLSNPDWQSAREALWGQLTAGDMFAAWVAHDLLHLRQLVELHWAYTVQSVQPYKVDYAGDW